MEDGVLKNLLGTSGVLRPAVRVGTVFASRAYKKKRFLVLQRGPLFFLCHPSPTQRPLFLSSLLIVGYPLSSPQDGGTCGRVPRFFFVSRAPLLDYTAVARPLAIRRA